MIKTLAKKGGIIVLDARCTMEMGKVAWIFATTGAERVGFELATLPEGSDTLGVSANSSCGVWCAHRRKKDREAGIINKAVALQRISGIARLLLRRLSLRSQRIVYGGRPNRSTTGTEARRRTMRCEGRPSYSWHRTGYLGEYRAPPIPSCCASVPEEEALEASVVVGVQNFVMGVLVVHKKCVTACISATISLILNDIPRTFHGDPHYLEKNAQTKNDIKETCEAANQMLLADPVLSGSTCISLFKDEQLNTL
ncbi:hypothetical protein B0H63DRAFT_449584 [Podospora didyma]|uniref:Uncharacterized protein n=1 Tax=Podospora didyma TaxID=330526 RepID=A0AAE0NQB8_9PEZI|nr:hypothetical protein B0H63DRAFT_449584 [Podospora didyma]